MATHRLPITNHSMRFSNDDVFIEPATIKMSNDVFGNLVIIFNDGASPLGFWGHFEIPSNYASTPEIVVVWTSTATSGDVLWQFAYDVATGTNTLDPSAVDETVEVVSASPSTARDRVEATITTLTAGNFSADATCQYLFKRDPSDADDDMAAAAILFGAFFQYSDT